MISPTAIVGYLALFVVLGFGFLFVNLLVGRFLRPKLPSAEKLEVYECGEPTIGSSFVQFDLRFYVVALLFIIFDVEVAFFFPWATVFGKATALMDERLSPAGAAGVYRELGVAQPEPALVAEGKAAAALRAQQGRKLAQMALVDIAVFFAVLMVGFAYVWRRGDLDWVRAVGKERSSERADRLKDQPVLSVV